MKTKYKYFILIIITTIASMGVYYYVQANKPVNYETDMLNVQKSINDSIKTNNNYSINDPKVILNPYGISPLTALVIFNTNDIATATVTIKGKNSDDDITNTFLPSKTHYISIYGLYPNYENTVIIESSGETKELNIKTDSLPNYIKNATSSTQTDEFFFTTSESHPVAYDKNGNVRWYLTREYSSNFTRLSNGYILLGNDELMKSPYYSSSLLEMDLLGKIYYEYKLPNGFYKDVYELDNGNLLVLSNDFEGNTVEDVIVEVDRNSGEIIKKFNLSKLFKNKTGNWISLNSLVYDSKTNTIITVGDKQDAIIAIDYSTGELSWSIGTNKSLKSSNLTQIKSPSSIVLTDEGFAIINDYSNLIEYKVDNKTKMVNETKNIHFGKSTNVNLQYSNGEYIVVKDNQILKIDNSSQTLMTTNNNLYSAYLSDMYDGDMFLINDSVSLGTNGITKPVDNKFIFFYKTDKDIIKKYDLTFVQNNNRLIVTGAFDKNDDVEIILDNILHKKAYTVDIASGKELDNGQVKAECYINKDGIYGKHYLYIKINDKIYKLHKYITS